MIIRQSGWGLLAHEIKPLVWMTLLLGLLIPNGIGLSPWTHILKPFDFSWVLVFPGEFGLISPVLCQPLLVSQWLHRCFLPFSGLAISRLSLALFRLGSPKISSGLPPFFNLVGIFVHPVVATGVIHPECFLQHTLGVFFSRALTGGVWASKKRPFFSRGPPLVVVWSLCGRTLRVDHQRGNDVLSHTTRGVISSHRGGC